MPLQFYCMYHESPLMCRTAHTTIPKALSLIVWIWLIRVKAIMIIIHVLGRINVKLDAVYHSDIVRTLIDDS